MNEFFDTNRDLTSIEAVLQQLVPMLGDAREAFMNSEAEYDRAYSYKLLMTKAQNPKYTQAQLEAEAIVGTHDKKLDCIKKESAYRRIDDKIRLLRDRIEVLKEKSYNLRTEAKI